MRSRASRMCGADAVRHFGPHVDALGKDWFDVKEAEASIFRPENGAYKLVAKVQMDE